MTIVLNKLLFGMMIAAREDLNKLLYKGLKASLSDHQDEDQTPTCESKRLLFCRDQERTLSIWATRS